MPVKLSLMSFSGTAMTKAGRLSGAKRQRIAAKFHRLHRRGKCALQGLGDERIQVRPEISLRCDRAFTGLADRRQIQKSFPIAVGKVFQQSA